MTRSMHRAARRTNLTIVPNQKERHMNPQNQAIIEKIKGDGKTISMAQIDQMMNAARAEASPKVDPRGASVFFGHELSENFKMAFHALVELTNDMIRASDGTLAGIPVDEGMEIVDDAPTAPPEGEDNTIDMFPAAPAGTPTPEPLAPAPAPTPTIKRRAPVA